MSDVPDRDVPYEVMLALCLVYTCADCKVLNRRFTVNNNLTSEAQFTNEGCQAVQVLPACRKTQLVNSILW